MNRRRILLRVAFVLSLAAVAGLTALVVTHPFDRSPVSSRGGRLMSVAEIPTPQYLQTDPRWGAELLGDTDEPLSASGCTVCCVSMALAHYGVDLPPRVLNRALVRSGGFTAEGWLRWSWVNKLSNGRVVADVPSRPEYETLDEALSNGWPVVTKIRLRGEVPHWVLIVAKEGAEYLARDPLVDKPLVPVSARSAIIESIRIIRPAD